MLVLDKSESVHERFSSLPSDLVPNVKLQKVKILLDKCLMILTRHLVMITYLRQIVALIDVVLLVLVNDLLAWLLINALAIFFVTNEELLARQVFAFFSCFLLGTHFLLCIFKFQIIII